MTKGRDAVRRVVHQPVLNGCHAVAQHIRVSGLLHGELREVADAVGNQLAALGCVQLSLFIEELVHVHASQLSDTFFLRHLAVEFINLLFQIRGGAAACHQC